MQFFGAMPKISKDNGYYLIGSLIIITILISLSPPLVAQQVSRLAADYRNFPLIGSRMAVWIAAQFHLLFAAFVLGVPIFAVICECIGAATKDEKYDRLAKEFTRLLMLAFSITATFGGILLFLLIGLYPKIFNYLTGIFSPTMYFYSGLFIGEAICIYLYYYAWDSLKDNKKLHITLGILLNFFGTLIMFTANAWASFMMSPAGINMDSGELINFWQAINNPTWWALNIHRFIANIAFGGALVAAYAAFRFLVSMAKEQRAHYDWMGYVGNFIAMLALIPLPFAGYKLVRDLYAHNSSTLFTLMGGEFSWLFIIQAAFIGTLFIGANYYLWLGLGRIPGGHRYMKYIIYMELLIFICQIIWMTPHTLVATLTEARKIGRAHHPVLGIFGLMAAKNTAINLIILVTFLSFILYRRANRIATVSWARTGKILQGMVLVVTAAIVIYYGVKGYFASADERFGFSVYQVLSVLTCMIVVWILDIFIFLGAKVVGTIQWGKMPERSQYVLIMIAVVFVLTMTLMGFARSGVRGPYHVDGLALMADTSPYARNPSLSFATMMFSIIALSFFFITSFIFWLTGLEEKGAVTVSEPMALSKGSALGSSDAQIIEPDTPQPEG